MFVLTLVTGVRPEYTEVLDVIKTFLSLPAVTNPANTNKLGLKLARSELGTRLDCQGLPT